VLQQQQYLLATVPQLIPLFELQVADGPEICTDCLKSKEIDGTIEVATDKSDESFTEGSLLKLKKRGRHEKR
jgi:hypothetical protein